MSRMSWKGGKVGENGGVRMGRPFRVGERAG